MRTSPDRSSPLAAPISSLVEDELSKPESLSGSEHSAAAREGPSPQLRICMFVYNTCTADPRVFKEAATLQSAGHHVEVVAVLDKRTVGLETVRGIRIRRIERNPPHYRLLRKTRLARRAVRLWRARTRRRVRRLRSNSQVSVRSLLAMRPPAKVRGAGVHGRSIALAAVAAPAILPIRAYRALRWRALRRSAWLRMLRHHRRASAKGFGAYRVKARMRRRMRHELLLADHGSVTGPIAAWRRRGPLNTGGSRLAGIGGRVDAAVSRKAYRALMVFHKPLMFSAFYRGGYRFCLGEDHFDVIHAHDLNTLPVAVAVARRSGARLVYDAHELYPEISTLSTRERRVWGLIEQLLIGRADKVLTVCESIADELCRRYGVATPQVVLNCPAAVSMPEEKLGFNLLRQRAQVSDGQPIILYQGGFTAHRGLHELVDAAAQLDRGVVVLMGWGLLEDELKSRVRDRGLEDRVRIIPPATPDELLAVTRGADIGVIPYKPVGLNNTFTAPNKLFEYIAVGLPIVGSRLPELERFLDGLGVGVTFEPGDPQDLAFAINHVLADPIALADMRARALSARADLSWDTQGAKLIGLYSDLWTSSVRHTGRPRRR